MLSLSMTFKCLSYSPRPANKEQIQAHYYLIDHAPYPQKRRSGKLNPAFGLLVVLAVCDEHRAEVLPFINIIQRLAIKQGGFVLSTRDECVFLRGVNAHVDGVGVVDKSFKQASRATAHDHDIFHKGEVDHMSVVSNLNSRYFCKAWPRYNY